MNESSFNRRALVGGGLLAAGMAAAARPASGHAAPAPGSWQPTAEPQDAWLDKPGTRHRLVVDTWTAAAADEALGYVHTFYATNERGYGLAPQTLGVVVVLRHFSTPFGYGDAVWAKYGTTFADLIHLTGHRAIRAAQFNPLLTDPSPDKASGKGRGDAEETPTLAGLASKGARFAVCAAATERLAGILAKSGDAAATVEAELKANLIPGAVLMASGIVAVNRAQEHGYSVLSVAG